MRLTEFLSVVANIILLAAVMYGGLFIALVLE